MFGSKNQKGITLVELLTTVVIIGIVAAMAVPKFQIAFERIKFRSATRDMTSMLRLARSYAVSSKEQHGVFFDSDALSCTLFKDIVNPGAYLFEVGDSVIKVDTLPVEFNFLQADNVTGSVVFKANGATDASVNIVAMAATNDLVGIHQHSIMAATGRIETSSSYY